jgi:hypothetical protein
MPKTFKVALLRFRFDLVERFFRGDFDIDHGLWRCESLSVDVNGSTSGDTRKVQCRIRGCFEWILKDDFRHWCIGWQMSTPDDCSAIFENNFGGDRRIVGELQGADVAPQSYPGCWREHNIGRIDDSTGRCDTGPFELWYLPWTSDQNTLQG